MTNFYDTPYQNRVPTRIWFLLRFLQMIFDLGMWIFAIAMCNFPSNYKVTRHVVSLLVAKLFAKNEKRIISLLRRHFKREYGKYNSSKKINMLLIISVWLLSVSTLHLLSLSIFKEIANFAGFLRSFK